MIEIDDVEVLTGIFRKFSGSISRNNDRDGSKRSTGEDPVE